MIRILKRLLFEPRRSARIIKRKSYQMMSRLFARAPFYLQSQMAINPKAFWHDKEFSGASGGFFIPGDKTARSIREVDPWDCIRRDMLVLLLRSILMRGLSGELAELGVYKGYTARLIHHYLPERSLHLFDTFSGFSDSDLDSEKEATGYKIEDGLFSDTSVAQVREHIAPVNDNINFHVGFFPQTFNEELATKRYAFVHMDMDLYEPTLAALKVFYPLMTPGGFIVVHDYNCWPGARKAVDEFFADKAEVPIPMPDVSGSSLIVKH